MINAMLSASFLLAALTTVRAVPVQPNTTEVVVREAPYVVSTVSSKSEHAWAKCRYCGSKSGYERTYKWDVYNHKWIETTDPDTVPDVCRKCRPRGKEQEELDQRERDLDEKINREKSRIRIGDKERELKILRRRAR